MAGSAVPGRVLTACLVALVVLSALGLHGFSLPFWHDKIDGSRQDEVLFGRAQRIRGDDWSASLPVALSQCARSVPFAPWTDLVGYGGVDVRVGYPAPVRDPVVVFRPQVWGYFVGRDFGLAWNWWFRILALFAAAFAAFRLLARGDAILAATSAAALAAAPFFQLFAYNGEPLTAAALAAFVAAIGIARAPASRSVVGWGVLLGWSMGCLALSVMYPPYQIVLAYVAAALTAAFVIRERHGVRAAGRPAFRAGVAVGAVALAASAVALFLVRSREAIHLLDATSYPGARISTGGEVPAIHLVNNFFTTLVGERALATFVNVSEAGAFFFLSPLLLAAALFESVRRRRAPDPVVAVTGLAVAALGLYAVFGLPESWARVVFLGRVPGQRVILGMGVADLALAAAVLSSPPALPRSAPWVLGAAWAAGLAALGPAILSPVGSAPWPAIVLPSLLFFAIGVQALRRRPEAVLALALVSIAATAWFNPVVRGGSDYLETNPLSRRILDLDRSAGGSTRWVVFDDPSLANLFRAIGVRAINGMHYYPQRELWSRLGLLERGAEQWNRYAHVLFELAQTPDEARIQLPRLDVVVLRIHPDHPAFARLGLDYVLWVGADRSRLDGVGGLSWLESIGDKHIFRVRRPGAPDAPRP